MNFKLLPFLVMLLFASNSELQASSQDSVFIPGKWSITAKYQFGFILTARPTIIHLQDQKTQGFEIDILKNAESDTDWNNLYNFPNVGVSYHFFNMGNPKELGNAHSLMGIAFIPILDKKRLLLQAKLGVGFGYVTKRFDAENNYKNSAIGSHLNGCVAAGINLKTRYNKRDQLSLGIDFTHYSNGTSQVPNSGLNITTANIGYQRYFGQSKKIYRERNLPFKKHNDLTIYLGGGFKEVFPPGGMTYGVLATSIEKHWKISNKSVLGGGIDYFYDGSTKNNLSSTENSFDINSKMGIHLSAGLEAGDLSIYFQNGYYLIKNEEVSETIYSTLSIRYSINTNFFVLLNLKSHFAKADYFIYGIGYKLK